MSNQKKGAKAADQSEAWKPRNNHHIIYGPLNSGKYYTARDLARKISSTDTFYSIHSVEVYNEQGEMGSLLKEIEKDVLVVEMCKSDFYASKFVRKMEDIHPNLSIILVFECSISTTFKRQFPYFSYIEITTSIQSDTWQDFLDLHIGDHFTNLELVQSVQRMHHKAIIQMNSDGCDTQDLDDMNAVARIVTAIMFENERRQQAAA